MVRRRLLIAQVALLAVLAALALPSSGSALSAAFIELTPTGPSPAVMTIPAGMYAVWQNEDTVTHTVAFSNGCSIQVAPGAIGQCTNGFSSVVGNYPYTVDGTDQARIDVSAVGRWVTFTDRRHAIRRGSDLLLRGKLVIAEQSPPAFFGPRMPVTVLARSAHHGPFHRIAVVTAKPLHKRQFPPHSVWRLRVRPRRGTTYIVEANSQPSTGPYWQQAKSKPFRVRFRR
jgi:plastocyanin